MNYGICNLSIVPVRILDSDKSEMINQLIYGDIIEILEEKNKWSKIRSIYDNYIGWIDVKQYFKIKNETFYKFLSNTIYLYEYCTTEKSC